MPLSSSPGHGPRPTNPHLDRTRRRGSSCRRPSTRRARGQRSRGDLGTNPAALHLQADSPPPNGPSVDVPWSASPSSSSQCPSSSPPWAGSPPAAPAPRCPQHPCRGEDGAADAVDVDVDWLGDGQIDNRLVRARVVQSVATRRRSPTQRTWRASSTGSSGWALGSVASSSRNPATRGASMTSAYAATRLALG